MPEDKRKFTGQFEASTPPGTHPGISTFGFRGVQIYSIGQNACQMPLYRTIKHPQEGKLVKQLPQIEYKNKIMLIINTVYKKSITLSPRGDSL